MKLNLKRPLVVFDLETTGTNILRDRIVEISVVKVMPDGTRIDKTKRLNPEMHIPEASTAVHHITDEMVADEPTFRQVAKSLNEFLMDAMWLDSTAISLMCRCLWRNSPEPA